MLLSYYILIDKNIIIFNQIMSNRERMIILLRNFSTNQKMQKEMTNTIKIGIKFRCYQIIFVT